MESLEAKGEANEKVFLLFVSGSNNVLTNQQFVNCANVEIQAFTPAQPCSHTCGRASFAVHQVTLCNLAQIANLRSICDRLCGAYQPCILLVAQKDQVLYGEK